MAWQALEAVEAVGTLVRSGFGVRYIVSPRYREEMNARLSRLSKAGIAFEIFETVIALVFLGVIVWVVIELVRNGSA